MQVTNIEDLKKVILSRWNQLDDVHEYLNPEGITKRLVLGKVYDICLFCYTLEELLQSDEFKALESATNKSLVYYELLSHIRKVAERAIASNPAE